VGFETVEIPIEDTSHIDPARVKQALDKNGLVCGTVCACVGPGSRFSRDAKTAEGRDAVHEARDRSNGRAGLPGHDRADLLVGRPGRRRSAQGIQKAMAGRSSKNLKTILQYAEARGKMIAWNRSTAFETGLHQHLRTRA